MSPSTEGRSAWPAQAHPVLRWVSTNNPFYVVSAGLFLVGLWLSFGDPRKAEDTFLLMAGLTSYTLVLALTAVLLIRFARVWDDARTVLLLVVLLFLATSVTFDHVLVFDVKFGVPIRGFVCNLVGLILAIGISEVLLRAVRLTLPLCYRGPYYLLLGLFFLYPLALTPFLNEPKEAPMMWGLFGFPLMAALIFLTLLPAIRRGRAAMTNNGSPWPWPLYPWALFGILGLAVPGRSILLCYSMHLIDVADLYDMTFGPYFLVPFGLALCVLLLEAGLVTGRAGLQNAALALPMALVGMAILGHRDEEIYRRFLDMFTAQLGADPAYCTLLASAGFYVYAALRRVPLAVESLTAALAMLTFVDPHLLKAREFPEPRPEPMIVAATLLIGLGVWHRGSRRCLLGLGGLAVGIALAIPADLEVGPFRWLIAFHLLLAGMLLIGWAFDDDLGRWLRSAAPSLILLTCVAVIILPWRAFANLPTWLLHFYPVAMALLLAGYGALLWHPPTLVMAGLILLTWTGASGWHIYRWLRSLLVGLDYLVLSLLVFALAIFISIGKSGVMSRRRPAEADERNSPAS